MRGFQPIVPFSFFTLLLSIDGGCEGGHASNVTQPLGLMARKLKNFTRIIPRVHRNATSQTAIGTKRHLDSPVPAAPDVGSQVSGAIVEKGIEVAGRLVDKQLEIYDQAKEKAQNFLKKELKLDIVPDKGWKRDDMFVPAGYHIDSTMSQGESEPEENGDQLYMYPNGVGPMMMNGCYGTGYQPTDPCSKAKRKAGVCRNMIDGGAFMGVGFDGRGTYSPESRRMSIVQRNCANKAKYDGVDVPDTMNVHGIYETSANMRTFESRAEYTTYLQNEAGVSGSYFGFMAGVNSAWGSSSAQARQQYMSLLNVAIDRYEIFMDEVKPGDLSVAFLREFMDLPLSYFIVGAPKKFQDFIQRWGTHYIKSSKFGGQLQMIKMMDASDVQSKSEFAVEMEMDYKSLFSSFHAKSSTKGGESQRSQAKSTSTSLVVQGGSQEIASILSDLYSPTFKNEFKEWLQSVPKYPKAFQFQMGSITNLINFRANDLFPDEVVSWGCEANGASLLTSTNEDGEVFKYYEVVNSDGSRTEHHCPFGSREELEKEIKRKRDSLSRAIDIYMEEGLVSITDVNLPACAASKKKDQQQNDYWKVQRVPSWKELTQGSMMFTIAFDMKEDLMGEENYVIFKNMTRHVRYKHGKWYTSEDDGTFHLYNAFPNTAAKQHKLSILGLLLTYEESDGSLNLSALDVRASRGVYPSLPAKLIGESLASASVDIEVKAKRSANADSPAPCNVKWSNALRFNPSKKDGRCLHFTAASEGSIYVVFATLPSEIRSWYYVRIAKDKVEIFKGKTLKTSTNDKNALALGDAALLQSYFVCIMESENNTLIEYGKTQGAADSGDIYLNAMDAKAHLHVRFYAFGNGKEEVQVMDAHVLQRHLNRAQCRGDTHKDPETELCVQNCHADCDPFAGCTTKTPGNPLPSECKECRVAKDVEEGICVAECPEGKDLESRTKICVPSYEMIIHTTTSLGYHSLLYGMPRLGEMSVCMWIKLTAEFDFESGNSYFLLTYLGMDWFSQRTNENSVWFQVRRLNSNGIKFSSYIKKSGETYFPADELADNEWHQVCVTWSGVTGYITRYMDGKLKMTGRRAASKGFIAGGGYLYAGLGGSPTEMRLTDLNIWDRILSEKEVASYYQACGSAVGNVKVWHDFYTVELRSDPKLFHSPTSCLAEQETST